MSKNFRNFISSQWHDVKGNAKWDFIKLSFVGCLTIPAGIAVFVKFIVHAPIWEALTIYIGLSIVLFLIWLAIVAFLLKTGERKEAAKKTVEFEPSYESNKALTRMVDAIKDEREQASKKLGHGPVLDATGVLIRFSNDIQTEAELVWYRAEFLKNGYSHFFNELESRAPELFRGQWLPILREARNCPQDVKNKAAFSKFIGQKWSGREKWQTIINEWRLQVDAILEVGAVSDLDIEFVPKNSTAAKSHPCQVRIYNRSLTRNADDLKVELVAFSDEFSGEYADKSREHFHPKLPLALKSVRGGQSINPGDGLEFIVFNIQMGTKIEGKVRQFVATFNSEGHSESLPRTAIFQEDKNYEIRISASAREMPRIEKEFHMVFSDENGKCQFKLNSIITSSEKGKRAVAQTDVAETYKRIKWQDIRPKLNRYYEALQTRRIEIERMTLLAYFGKYQERFYAGYKFDEQTQGLISEIEDYLRLEVRDGTFELFIEGHGVNPMEPNPTHPMYINNQQKMREIGQQAIDRLSQYLKKLKMIIDLH